MDGEPRGNSGQPATERLAVDKGTGDDAVLEIRYESPLAASGWTLVYHMMTLDRRISDGAYRLYLLLHKYAQQKTKAWPSVRRLAEDLGVSTSTIKRRLQNLTEVNLIHRKRETFGGVYVTYLLEPNGAYLRGLEGGTPIGLKNEPYDSIGLKNEPYEGPIGLKNEPSYGSKMSPHEESIIEQVSNDNDDDDNPPPIVPPHDEIPSPLDEAIAATWLAATNRELAETDLVLLGSLLGPGPEQTDLASLLATIIELGRRVERVTPELVEAVVTGRMAMPPLVETTERPPVPQGPDRGRLPDRDPLLAEVTRLYEAEIGTVTEGVAQRLRALTEEHRNLERWRQAFDAVVRSNVRRLDYLEACLEGKRDDGKRPRRQKQSRTGGRRSRQARSGRRRFGGWTQEEIKAANRRAAIELGEIPAG